MNRRNFNQIVTRGLMAAAALPGLSRIAAAAGFEPTASQAEGPYYPVNLPADRDWNLLKVGAGEVVPAGTPLDLSGRVLDSQGAPIPGALVEIWQADSAGLYDHPRAPDTASFDRTFQGFGATETDDDGRYRFLTLVPTPYTGRPPHIHVKIWIDGREQLTTQLYIKDHPENSRDGILMRLFSGDREGLMMEFDEAEIDLDGAILSGKSSRFDFVV